MEERELPVLVSGSQLRRFSTELIRRIQKQTKQDLTGWLSARKTKGWGVSNTGQNVGPKLRARKFSPNFSGPLAGSWSERVAMLRTSVTPDSEGLAPCRRIEGCVLGRWEGKDEMRNCSACEKGEPRRLSQNPGFIYCVPCARFQSRKTRKRSSLACGGTNSSVSFPSVRIVNRIWSR